MTPLKFITEDERNTLNNENILKGGYRDDFEAGTCFYMSWLFDPKDLNDLAELEINKALAREKGFHSMLSVYYWEQWALIRPPIFVLTPNRRPWNIDGISNNGPGWTVILDNGILPSETNRQPQITCSPSIVVSEYHGYLKSGIFTDDLEGRSY